MKLYLFKCQIHVKLVQDGVEETKASQGLGWTQGPRYGHWVEDKENPFVAKVFSFLAIYWQCQGIQL